MEKKFKKERAAHKFRNDNIRRLIALRFTYEYVGMAYGFKDRRKRVRGICEDYEARPPEDPIRDLPGVLAKFETNSTTFKMVMEVEGVAIIRSEEPLGETILPYKGDDGLLVKKPFFSGVLRSDVDKASNWANVEEAAKRVGVSTSTIYTSIHEGEVTTLTAPKGMGFQWGSKVGLKHLVDTSSIDTGRRKPRSKADEAPVKELSEEAKVPLQLSLDLEVTEKATSPILKFVVEVARGSGSPHAWASELAEILLGNPGLADLIDCNIQPSDVIAFVAEMQEGLAVGDVSTIRGLIKSLVANENLYELIALNEKLKDEDWFCHTWEQITQLISNGHLHTGRWRKKKSWEEDPE